MMDKQDFPQDWVQPEPDIKYLIGEWQTVIGDQAIFIDQCRDNYMVRYARWAGQTDDGKKRGPKAFPWEGASDLQVFLADELINHQKAMLCTAFRKSTLAAVPVEGNDIARAKVVGNFMRWLIMTQMPYIEREVELCADYMLEKGIAATGQFWERCVASEKTVLSLEQISQTTPDLAALIQAPENDEMMSEMLIQAYPTLTKKRARKALKQLRDEGQAEMVVPGQVYNRPMIRAFALDEDLFLPINSTDIEHVPYCFRVQYYRPQQLREKVYTDGWDAKWVEAVIETQRGKDGDIIQEQDRATLSRNFVDDTRGFKDLVQVVWAYQRLTDEDNIPGIYETVFNPYVPPDVHKKHKGYAITRLLDYKHGQYPFVIHRREYLSRRLHDSRGIPEVARPYQEQIKVQRDARIDNTSLATLPPLRHPVGRPPSVWGPGARVPERRPNEYTYAERPPFPDSSVEVERMLMESVNQYFGRSNNETDINEARAKQQNMVERWLGSWAQVFQQVWQLFQQFGDDEVFFRVIGSVKGEPQRFQKGDPRERYDMYLNYDVLMQDSEKAIEKIKLIIELAQTVDRNGQIDYSELLQAAVESIDPILGERFIQPKEAATKREVDEENNAIANMVAGVVENIPLGAANELRLQVMQQWAQSPVAQQHLQNPEVAKAFKARAQQYQHQIQQQQNALIGVYGAQAGGN